MNSKKWYYLDPDDYDQGPYDLSEDQRDLLAGDLLKAIPALEDGGVSTRRIVDEVLDLLEVWHG